MGGVRKPGTNGLKELAVK